MALSRQVINLFRRERIHQTQDPLGASQIAEVKVQTPFRQGRIFVNVVNASCIERTRPAHNPMHFVSFGEEQFGEIGAILSGDAGDQRTLHLLHSLSLEVSLQRQYRVFLSARSAP